MLAASLVCFSMITVLAAVAHVFHRAARAPEVLVGHGLGLTAVVLVVVGDGPLGAVFAGYSVAMILAVAAARRSTLGLLLRVIGAITMSAAVAVDTLVLLDRPVPYAGWALSAAVLLLAGLAARPALRRDRPRAHRVAAASALLLLCLGGALAPHGVELFLAPLLAAHAIVTLLRVAPERLPALADVVAAALAALLAAAAALAIAPAPTALPLLVGAAVLAVSSLARLLVGNARLFALGAVERPARPAPRLPLEQIAPLYDRLPVPAPARGQASLRSLLEDAVEGAAGRFLVEDETDLADSDALLGDLPPIVSALRGALSAAALDEDIVRVRLRGGLHSLAIELDQAVPAEIAERARGLLAPQGGRVFVSEEPETTRIVLPARPQGGVA